MKTKRISVILAAALVSSSAIAVYAVQFLRKEATEPSSRPTLMMQAMARESRKTPVKTTQPVGARRAVTVRVTDQHAVMQYVRPSQRVDLIVPGEGVRPDTILRGLPVIGPGARREKDASGSTVTRLTLSLLVTEWERMLLKDADRSGPLTFRLTVAPHAMSPDQVKNRDMLPVTVRVNNRSGIASSVVPKQRVDLMIPAGDGMPETIIRNLTVIATGTAREKNARNNWVARATLTLLVTAEEATLLEDGKLRGPMSFTLAGAGGVSQSAPKPSGR